MTGATADIMTEARGRLSPVAYSVFCTQRMGAMIEYRAEVARAIERYHDALGERWRGLGKPATSVYFEMLAGGLWAKLCQDLAAASLNLNLRLEGALSNLTGDTHV